MRPLKFFFLGNASWFFAYGIHLVTFSWLVTIFLQETPDRIGLAQMAFLLPTMLLILIIGSVSDHFGGRKIVMFGQGLGAITAIILSIAIFLDQFNYPLLLVYALLMGTAQALVTPSRDGLIIHVADGFIQRRVIQASNIQFFTQMIGFILAYFADAIGPIIILLIQAASLIVGGICFKKLSIPSPQQENHHLSYYNLVHKILQSTLETFNAIRHCPTMRAVIIQNCGMGIFYMGSYIVTLPLLIREVYAGSSPELATINIANSLGLVIVSGVLLRIGDIYRQGRALLLSLMIGCGTLGFSGFSSSFYVVVLCVLAWGICGGVTMSMSRTIMQEHAPAGQSSRVMAFYFFSLMGSAPIGAILNGYLSAWFGPKQALIVAASMMFSMILIITITSCLWQLDSRLRRKALSES